MTHLKNLLLFAALALWHLVPPWRWREAWEGVQADHLAEVRKMILELKCQGKVREDKEGYLYPVDQPYCGEFQKDELISPPVECDPDFAREIGEELAVLAERLRMARKRG